MSSTVAMVRDAVERPGRDRFSCSLLAWDFLRDLGEAFGWRPRGTTYTTVVNPAIEISVRHNYQPGDALDSKRVDAEDAIAWASALETAKRSPHFAAMIETRSVGMVPGGGAPMEAALQSVIEEFVAYAYGGAFAFAISPEPVPSAG
jgi:hypothetical protein